MLHGTLSYVHIVQWDTCLCLDRLTPWKCGRKSQRQNNWGGRWYYHIITIARFHKSQAPENRHISQLIFGILVVGFFFQENTLDHLQWHIQPSKSQMCISYIIDTFLLWSNFLVKSLPGGTKTDIHEGTGAKNMHRLLLGFALQLFASAAAFVQWWCWCGRSLSVWHDPAPP